MHPNTYERAGRVRGRSGTVYWSHKAARPCRSVPRCVCADLLVKRTRPLHFAPSGFGQWPASLRCPLNEPNGRNMEGGGLHVPTKAQGMASSGSACGRAKPQSARAAAPAQKKDLAVHPLSERRSSNVWVAQIRNGAERRCSISTIYGETSRHK